MKIRYIKYWAFAAVLGMGTVSCEDFLNRPTEDNAEFNLQMQQNSD